MAVTFLETGGDTTFANPAPTDSNGFWAAGTSVTAQIASDFVHGQHKRSMSFAPSGNFIAATASGTAADAGTRISMYIYIATLPSAVASIFTPLNGSNNRVVNIRLTSAGVLQLWDGTTAQRGSDGATLSAGTWYRISLAYTISSTTVNECRLYVNGVLSISTSNVTLGAIGTNRWLVGNFNSDLTLDFRGSDFYSDDSSALTDTGDIWVTAKRPISNGTLNQFTTQIGTGGSPLGSGHSQQVNERPLDTTNGWSISTTSVQTEEYTIQPKNSGDFDISSATIVDYMGWISASIASTSNTPVQHIIVAGVATTKTLTTSPAIYTKIAGSTTYPTGGTDIGMDSQFTAVATLASLFECGVIVAFIPSGPYQPTVAINKVRTIRPRPFAPGLAR